MLLIERERHRVKEGFKRNLNNTEEVNNKNKQNIFSEIIKSSAQQQNRLQFFRFRQK